MKTRLIFIFLVLVTIKATPQSTVISNLAQKLNDYYQFYPLEKIQLTTDKEVYKPEEIIWFSLLITNGLGQQIEPVSKECRVSLFSSDGIRVSSDVYQTKSGLIKGDLLIPKGLREGKYVLVANTALFSQADEAFYKLIYLNPKNEEAIRLKEITAPELLIPGQSNTYSFQLEEMNGSILKKEKIEYEVYYGDELILNDKIKTDDAGKGKLTLSIPNKNYATPLELRLFTRKNQLDYQTILPVQTERIDIKFYPEGGKLIAGSAHKLGFTAHDQLGNPVSISGEITDESGTKVNSINTLIPGYGVSPLALETGKKYLFHITSKPGQGQTYELPPVEEGLNLAVSRTDQDFIYANLTPAKGESQNVYLLAHKGAAIFWASEVELKGPMRLKIPKEQFPNGISQLSVFDENKQVLGNRLVFVDQQATLQFQLSAPEQVKANDIFKFTLETNKLDDQNMPKVNFSISAEEETYDWASNWEIWLLINSDLEHPFPDSKKLFDNKNLESTVNYLLIANELKNFDWNIILDFEQEWEQNKFESSGLFGKVLNDDDEPVSNAKVSFMNSQNMQILNSSTDGNGEFFQQAIDAAKLDQFAVKAIGPDGNENLKVAFELSPEEQIKTKVLEFIKEQKDIHQAQFSSEFYQKNASLFTKMKIEPKEKEDEEPSYKKFLQTSTSLLDVLKIIKPYRLDGDKIIFPGGTNSINAQDGALIVIDGQKVGTSASVLNAISPLDVESINVSTSPIDIQRYTGLNSVGLIEIQTKRGELIQPAETEETENIHENGYRIPRDFWLKKSENKNMQPTTLFWNPAVNILQSGRSEFEVATNQVLGKFQIQAYAIDRQGRIIKVNKVIEVIP